MQTIPASAIVNVVPGVISAGGTGLDLQALVLTEGTRVPIGAVLAFPSALAVSGYFGGSSAEAAAAANYFAGFQNSNIKPGSILFAQFNNDAAVAAWLRGGSLAAMTLAQLQALSGVLAVTVNGTLYTSGTINLSAATSFSNAATIIQAAFVTPPFTVTFDSVASAFIVTSTTTGAASTISFGSGSISAALALSLATGAVNSQGADVTTAAAFMAGIIAITTNWASFVNLTDPDDGAGNTIKQAFAAWNNTQDNAYVYVAWDTDITPTESTAATTSLGYILKQNQSSGTCPIYSADNTLAMFVCGAIASLDFTEHNGRITFAFKSQAGLVASVTSQTAAANLMANGYNFYGAYATANDEFVFLYPGSVTGEFKWLDSYVDQIWLNNSFQLDLMTLMTQAKSVPYAPPGYAQVRAACMDTINAGLNFGAFIGGVPLSSLQASEVNNAAGLAIDQVLSSQGWYLQILPAAAQTRANRQSPPMTFWYMDGGSVQQINLASIEVQ